VCYIFQITSTNIQVYIEIRVLSALRAAQVYLPRLVYKKIVFFCQMTSLFVYVQLFVSSCLCSVVCVQLFVLSCLCSVVCVQLFMSVVCVQLFVLSCLCSVVCVQLFVSSCLCSVVCVQLFMLSCLTSINIYNTFWEPF